MVNNKPWYSSDFIDNGLDNSNFLLTDSEKRNVIHMYSRFINFDDSEYNFNNIKKMNFFLDFIEDDYDCEDRTESYINEFLNHNSGFIYAIPLVFSYSDFYSVLNDFEPSLIAKFNSSFGSYLKCINSMVSDYSGEFILFYDDFSSFMIIKRGYFYLRGTFEKNILHLDNWNRLLKNEISMYEIDKQKLLLFEKISNRNLIS